MRLADFIDARMRVILGDWEAFAGTILPAAMGMDALALRDHADDILRAVAADLRTAQTPEQQEAKSKGAAPHPPGPRTAAETHAVLRAAHRFTIRQLVSEYRALRACVLRRWRLEFPDTTVTTLEDVERFNEAIDQAVAESVEFFANEVDRWRHVFLGVLGHDLRGPLNAILMTSQLLSRMSDGTPLSQQTARLIRSGERMRELLDDLLDYSRTSLEAGIVIYAREVDLQAAVTEEVELLRAALAPTQIEFDTKGAPIVACCDPSRIRQVLSNLVTNAQRHGAPGRVVRVALSADDQTVTLSVHNEGPPIPRDLLDRIFEPLRRGSTDAPASRESLGLGLFIVNEVVRAHDGTIAVTSDGTTSFTVSLPRRLESCRTAPAQPA
jgi:signal transduction histidine kinase